MQILLVKMLNPTSFNVIFFRIFKGCSIFFIISRLFIEICSSNQGVEAWRVEVKYLKITLNQKLKFGWHVQNIASQTLRIKSINMLHPLIKYNSPQDYSGEGLLCQVPEKWQHDRGNWSGDRGEHLVQGIRTSGRTKARHTYTYTHIKLHGIRYFGGHISGRPFILLTNIH